MPLLKTVTILKLIGIEERGSLYFQSSALPTELPGHWVRKRVLNRRAGFESSLKRVLEQIW